MSDLERMLRDELTAVEGGVTTPVVDVAGLTAVGRRERRRRTGILAAAGAAAAVVATVGALAVVPGLTRDSAGPAPAAPTRPDVPASVDELPVGAPSLAPYVVGSRLHVGEASSLLGGADVLDVHYAAGTTVAVVEDEGVWSALMSVDGGPFVQLARATRATNPFTPLPSADGAYVAVATRQGPTRVDVSLYGADGGSEALGTHSYDGDAVRDAFSLLNVTDDGRVLTSTTVFSIWAPGAQPVEVTGLGGVSGHHISYPRGVATDGVGPDGAPVYGTISREGQFEAVGDLPIDSVAWAPGGRTWVVPDLGSGELEVDGEDRDAAVLPLPSDLDWRAVGWESDTDVVLERVADADQPDVQVRCDVVELICEQVPLG